MTLDLLIHYLQWPYKGAIVAPLLHVSQPLLELANGSMSALEPPGQSVG